MVKQTQPSPERFTLYMGNKQVMRSLVSGPLYGKLEPVGVPRRGLGRSPMWRPHICPFLSPSGECPPEPPYWTLDWALSRELVCTVDSSFEGKFLRTRASEGWGQLPVVATSPAGRSCQLGGRDPSVHRGWRKPSSQR